MSLYGKYRPQNFANLVGQEHIRQTVLNEISNGLLTHAFIFAGPRGTGKTSTARLIAKALNCLTRAETGEPCDTCEMCTNIRDGALIDVLEIDAASNRGIDEIRDLKEKISYAPTRAKTKTYIIDEVHMLTKEAFNALLKTLEEPPENVYFILCTTEIHKIPETIISRCQRFDFKRIDVRTIMTRLSFIAQNEGIAADDEAVELIARHVEGGLRDAIGLFEQLTLDKKLTADYVRSHLGITGHQTIQSLIDLLNQKELTRALHIVNEVHNEGYDLQSFVREVLECLRENLITGIQQGKSDAGTWLAMIEHFDAAREMMRSSVIPQLPLEIAAIKICGSGAAAPLSVKAPEAPKAVAQPQPVRAPTTEASRASVPDQEVETVQIIKEEIDLERFKNVGAIKENWTRVVEKVEPASLGRSLRQGHIHEQDDIIRLDFSSRFHMDIVNTHESRAKVENVIRTVFGRTVSVQCSLSAAPLQESAPKSVHTHKTHVKAPTTKASAEDIAKRAMEMFD